MSMSNSFLGGAKDRLLPASIPFRFFLGAAGFHILAWVALFIGADDLAGFSGGTGPVLAAIHLLTLGVLALSALGASYQLLPVVTRAALARAWPAALSFWLLVPGILLLTWGMAGGTIGGTIGGMIGGTIAGMTGNGSTAMTVGGGLVSAGLALFAILTADNLRRAGSIPVIAAHGWGALAALVALVGIALALIANFQGGFLSDHPGMASVHMVLASFGFMGLLVLGLSQVLIPMFVLSHALPARPGWVQLALAIAGLVMFTIGILADIPGLVLAAFLAAAGATYAHYQLMRAAFSTSMRKRLGLSFVMIRVSWALLGLGLLIGLGLALDLAIPNAPALFGFVVLVGWLLTFLTGILQRIMPFLASMHASGKSGRMPLLSDLTAETPLRIHAVCHWGALALVAVGIVTDLTICIQAGAALGFIGSLAFAAFAVNVVIQLNTP